MSAVTFRRYQEQVVLDAIGISKERMQESAKIEAQIVRQKGQLVKDVPFTSVITDAFWAKRASGGAYDSPGGCAVVIGYETDEVIDLIIRVMPCAVCDRADKEARQAKAHICFRNYDRSRSFGGMETDDLVEAFTTSIQKYGLIYKYLIADGDSSVLATIQMNNPYRDYGVQVKKIECTNHLLRNFYKKSKVIERTKGSNEARGDGSSSARKTLKNNLLKLRVEVTAAATRRRENNSLPLRERITLLTRDILNVASHVFDEHKEYAELDWPCGANRAENEENLVPLLETCGIYGQLRKLLRDLSVYAESLLYNVTNNSCEWFNNIICKAIGGKRVNFTMRGSYTGRCSLAVLQSTNKGTLSSLYQGLNKSFPKVITQMEKNRQLQVERNREYETSKRRVSQHKQSTDKDYGPTAMKLDVSPAVYDTLVKNHTKGRRKNKKIESKFSMKQHCSQNATSGVSIERKG